jgi:hypothetical protein
VLNCLLPSIFLLKFCIYFLTLPFAWLIFRDFITMIIFGEECVLWDSVILQFTFPLIYRR